MPPQPPDPEAVFLNIPYDQDFSSLCVAYTAGLHCLGAYIHGGSPEGIFRELRNAFWREDAPSVAEMASVHRFAEAGLKEFILPGAGATSVYGAAVFRELGMPCHRLTELL
jgi:hypothetical protein